MLAPGSSLHLNMQGNMYLCRYMNYEPNFTNYVKWFLRRRSLSSDHGTLSWSTTTYPVYKGTHSTMASSSLVPPFHASSFMVPIHLCLLNTFPAYLCGWVSVRQMLPHTCISPIVFSSSIASPDSSHCKKFLSIACVLH